MSLKYHPDQYADNHRDKVAALRDALDAEELAFIHGVLVNELERLDSEMSRTRAAVSGFQTLGELDDLDRAADTRVFPMLDQKRDAEAMRKLFQRSLIEKVGKG